MKHETSKRHKRYRASTVDIVCVICGKPAKAKIIKKRNPRQTCGRECQDKLKAMAEPCPRMTVEERLQKEMAPWWAIALYKKAA